ncbi:MAG: hypothetical protein ABIL58_15885 [Pseudomonadota bacterium]
MRKKYSKASVPSIESRPSADPEIDYSPKTYSPREMIVSVVKISTVGGIIALALLLMGYLS